MLLIRCSACKGKLFKYKKIGQGEVHRCHKARISEMLKAEISSNDLSCPCGQRIGLDKGTFYKMIRKAFTYTGVKVSS